ncbi:MAG: ACT domain-containing protein [Bacillota bacterium]
MAEQQEAYIIYDSILPEAMKKTAQAKALLAKGEAKSINEAVQLVGISRSVFYKYKDGIFPFYRQETNRVVTFSIKMNHKAGILMSVLNVLAASNCNINTINQDIPLSGMAVATITAEISDSTMTLGGLISAFLKLDGVISAETIGDVAG